MVIFAFTKMISFSALLPNSDTIEDKIFLYQLFYCVHRLVANENLQYVKNSLTGPYNYSKIWCLLKKSVK